MEFELELKVPFLVEISSNAAFSLSFTSVKEGKITRKDPFDYKKWGLQQ